MATAAGLSNGFYYSFKGDSSLLGLKVTSDYADLDATHLGNSLYQGNPSLAAEYQQGFDAASEYGADGFALVAGVVNPFGEEGDFTKGKISENFAESLAPTEPYNRGKHYGRTPTRSAAAAGSDQGKLLILLDIVAIFARILALKGTFRRQKGGFKDGTR